MDRHAHARGPPQGPAGGRASPGCPLEPGTATVRDESTGLGMGLGATGQDIRALQAEHPHSPLPEDFTETAPEVSSPSRGHDLGPRDSAEGRRRTHLWIRTRRCVLSPGGLLGVQGPGPVWTGAPTPGAGVHMSTSRPVNAHVCPEAAQAGGRTPAPQEFQHGPQGRPATTQTRAQSLEGP